MTDVETRAWHSLVTLLKKFVGREKATKLKVLAETLLHRFHFLDCRMSIMLLFLNGHLDEFPTNHGDVSNDRFH